MRRRALSEYAPEVIDYFVRQVPFFDELARLDRPQFDLFMANSVMMDLEAGEVLIEKGSIGNKFYSLVQGKLGIFTEKTPSENAIGELVPSQLVGVLSIINQEPRTATVAVSSAEGATVFETDFSIIGELDDFSQVSLSTKILLCREVVRRIRTTLEMSQRLSNDELLAEELSTLMFFEGVASTIEELEYLVELASALTWLLENWNNRADACVEIFDEQSIKARLVPLLKR